ncbi:MAG: hypothetical protein DHS20C21_18760 [Gemmatimonadota bacterium]|nr:MAG: hypothetical protein DHS20C21_18760 [Gemmatimonadota bacterium]
MKFDVFQRLNTNTVPLNAQELRNCMFRGTLNELLKDVVTYGPWLRILRKKAPDKRMRDEELALRFFSFHMRGLDSYSTPQKLWLNETAQKGMNYSQAGIDELRSQWERAIDAALAWLAPDECFRRIPVEKPVAINRALFDLTMMTAVHVGSQRAPEIRDKFRSGYETLLGDEEFNDLISRAVDHKSRTKRRFELWDTRVNGVLG